MIEGSTSRRPEGGWAAVFAGWQSAVALAHDGTLWTWGDGRTGALGLGDTTHRLEPSLVAEGSTWRAVSAGLGHVLAILHDGSLWAWGYNVDGQLGLGPTEEGFVCSTRLVPDSDAQEAVEDMAAILTLNGWPVHRAGGGAFGTDWMQVAAGVRHSLALKGNGSLWAWGANDAAQLGLGDHTPRYLPARVGTDVDWALVSAGSHSLAVKTDGSLWAWGSAADGRLGLGDETYAATPAQVGHDHDWLWAHAGMASVAIKRDGTLWTWGDNRYGQLGHGDLRTRREPTQVGRDDGWAVATTGFTESMLAARSDGSLWSWGRDERGELGLPSAGPHDRPARVPHVPACVSLAVGGLFAVAVDHSADLWAWGENGLGQLGIGSLRKAGGPTRITVPGKGFPIAVAAGDVTVTAGQAGRFRFTVDDACRDAARVTAVARSAGLEALQRWPLGELRTNVEHTVPLPCDLPVGEYLWYVYAVAADGSKQPRSRPARLSVRPPGLRGRLPRRPQRQDPDEDAPTLCFDDLILGREDA